MEIYQPHKIAFIGTSSVGKSTIYEWCKREIADSGCAVIDEAATIYLGSHSVPEEQRFTEGIQREIQSLAIGAELALFAEAKSNLPDSKAAAEIIKALDLYTGLKVDPKPLLKQAEAFEEKLKDIIQKGQQAEDIQEEKEKKLGYVG
ncbi:MAG: PAC2 family protein [Candidatus Levybacteria bacterium]|nr:PAC2 family protein [Candidatus Levybacteria bacterium]